jgi:hypothetical protein
MIMFFHFSFVSLIYIFFSNLSFFLDKKYTTILSLFFLFSFFAITVLSFFFFFFFFFFIFYLLSYGYVLPFFDCVPYIFFFQFYILYFFQIDDFSFVNFTIKTYEFYL